MKSLLMEASQPAVAIAIVVIGIYWTSLLIPDNVDEEKTFFSYPRLLSASFPLLFMQIQ